MTRHNSKWIGVTLVAAVLLALAVGLGAAAVQSYDITTDDPSNESINVSLDFSGSTDATVALENASGDSIDSTTLSGTSGDTLATTLDPSNASAGDTLTLNITATDETVVSVNETSLTKTTTALNVTNATTESLTVDVAFNSTTNTSATVTVTDGDGSEVLTDTLDYVASDYADNATTLTHSYNDTDGLTAGDDLTVEVTYDDPAAYESAYAQVDDGSDGLFGGGLFGDEILGQDPMVALGGLLVIGGAGYYARREEMI